MAMTDPATDKQKAFIRRLIAERDADARAHAYGRTVTEIRAELNANLGALTKRMASDAIGELLEIPRRGKKKVS